MTDEFESESQMKLSEPARQMNQNRRRDVGRRLDSVSRKQDMDALREMLQKRKQGMNFAGIPSFCTASDLVIEACLQQALRFDDCVLVEATANQVNQYGGYTGMKPADYRDFVYKIADKVGFPRASRRSIWTRACAWRTIRATRRSPTR